MEGMKGKVVIVTGATSGIGYAAAELFAKEGLKVVAAGRSEKAGLTLVDTIRKAGGEALFVQTDVSDDESVQELVARAKREFGGVDFAFNNAGIEGVLVPLAEQSEENWDDVMNINLKGVWLCLKHELPAILERGGGAIVNVATNLTRIGIPGTSIYTASKAGVEALTQVAAVEYGKKGVRINAINPGGVDTPMLSRVLPPPLMEKVIQSNPLLKIATPLDVAQTALWLLSPMAGHINGVSLLIDGGDTLAQGA